MGKLTNKFCTASCLSAVLSISSPSAWAEEDHDDDHHQSHEAHVHGAWEMFAALDDARLSITIKGPAVDVFGFEAVPTTDEERATVLKMASQLQAAETLLNVDDRARCALSAPGAVKLPDGFPHPESNADAGGDEGHDEEHAEDHEDDHNNGHHEDHEGPHDDHDHDEHDDDHDEDHKDSHGDHHEDNAHDEGAHADHDIHTNNVEVTYLFDCAAPARLGKIAMSGFNAFPAIETVDAVFLGDAASVARRLTRKSQTLKLD